MQHYYLSKSQYETLLDGGSVTVTKNGTSKTITYSDEDMYHVEVGVYRHDIYIEHLYGSIGNDATNVYLSFINDDPEPIEIGNGESIENLTGVLAIAFPHKMVPVTYGRFVNLTANGITSIQLTNDWDTVILHGDGSLVDGLTDTYTVNGFSDSVVKIL